MSESERKTMMILADTIQGEINRMCVTLGEGEGEQLMSALLVVFAIVVMVGYVWMMWEDDE